jgi:hypothetical protein
MARHVKHVQNEEGFVLIAALMFMVLLTIIGIAATTDTSLELQIAGNDKVHKQTFSKAEAGVMLGVEILEQSFNCTTGFKETSASDSVADLNWLPIPRVRIYKRGDYLLGNNSPITCSDAGDITTADAAYPIANLGSGIEADYLYFGGETRMLAGGALEQAAGYEGKGKAAGQGGVAKFIDIYSQHRGLVNSESVILLGWRHLVSPSLGDPYGWCE